MTVAGCSKDWLSVCSGVPSPSQSSKVEMVTAIDPV